MVTGQCTIIKLLVTRPALPQRINICGKLKLVCFDKTGTLTEDGLDMWGVVPTKSGTNTQPVTEGEGGMKNSFEETCRDLTSSAFDPKCSLINCLTTCHSLTMINGSLIGDPLDIKMFESTGWVLEEPNVADTSKFDNLMPTVVRPPAKPVGMLGQAATSEADLPHEVGIIRQFTFSSAVARMSVITR